MRFFNFLNAYKYVYQIIKMKQVLRNFHTIGNTDCTLIFARMIGKSLQNHNIFFYNNKDFNCCKEQESKHQ